MRTCGAEADAGRLASFLARVTPGGVTPLAERLRELRPRLQAFAAEAGPSGQCAFLVLVTDGAPTPPDSGTPTPAAAAAALRELRGLTTVHPPANQGLGYSNPNPNP